MTLPPSVRAGSDDELIALRREVEALRQRVAELQRRSAMSGAVEPADARNLSAREARLLEAERSAHVGSWDWDIASGTIFWSDELFRLLGFDPSSVVPTSERFFSRIHPADVERVRGVSEQSLRTGVAQEVDFRLQLPGGVLRYVTMSAAILFDAAGKPLRAVGTVRDLTEARILHEQMRRALHLLEQAQAIAMLGSYVFNPATGELEWSSGMYPLFGLTPEVAPTLQTYMDSIHPDDRARIQAIYERSLRGEHLPEFEMRIVRTDGEVRKVRVRTVAVEDGSGRVIEYRGTIQDITEQAALSEQIARIGKMDAVGRLAGGIAHDFNNLLTVIGANLDLWAENAGLDAELVDVRRALGSAKSLTERLLAFGRKAHLVKVVVDPNELVARTADLVRRVMGGAVRLELDLTPRPPPIDVDPALIEQAVINLVINARDAMPSGGTVALRTRVSAGPLGALVHIEVEDNGPGLDPQLKEKIFEPFFTTKGEHGTGLGLSMVLGTVEQHGGTVEVESEPGRGALFRLRLPARRGARPTSLAPEARRPEIAHIGREILVVEDEPLVASVIARTLERKGHAVVLAHRPTEALQLWREHPQISLVICDVSMAEMRGPALVEQLRKTRRELRVLYVTGYREDGAQDAAGEPMLNKPFTPHELMVAVSDLAS